MIRHTMSVDTQSGSPEHPYFRYAVAFILILAAVLRLYGQDWDDGHYFHPDERFIATVMDGRLSIPSLSDVSLLFDPANSPLNTRSDDEAGNPQEFAYGSLPFLVVLVIGSVFGALSSSDPTSYANVGEFGRFITAIVDIATVAIVILFARRAFGQLTAIVAGLLVACSVVLIQLAHFFTVDTWVTFFSIATLYAALRVMQGFELRWILIAAALGGAALATKVSVGVLGIPVLVAMAIGVQRVTSTRDEAIGLYLRRLLTAGMPAAFVFLLFEPYALWRPGPFIDDIRRQWEIVNGQFDIPFTRQFVGTISGINEIENLVLWGIAPGFGLAAIVSTAIGLYLALRKRDPRYILIMSWIVPYFYVIASSEARFIRYAAPLIPPLAIIVAHQLAEWWSSPPSWWRSRAVPGVVISVVVGITFVWSLMFMTVYAGTHPRVAASDWIYSNVEPGSTLTYEVWDDRLPVILPTGSGDIYQYEALDLYSDRPNDEAVAFIAGFLDEADYIILASQRLSHSIPRLPWRYPVQSEYYRLLEEEKLGFELALEATNYPGFGPFRINTLRADESFSVYDHPPVRVYRKLESLSTREIELRFAHAAAQPRIPQRYAEEPTLRLDQPVNQRESNQTAEWSGSLTSNTVAAVVFWLIALMLLTISAVPLTAFLFPHFPDAGLGLSTLTGLLGTGAVVWLVWSLEFSQLHAWLVAAALVVFAMVGWVLFGVPGDWRREVSRRRSYLVAALAAFSLGFGVVLLFRLINPDLWHPFYGGEKPMETAYLNAILRTSDYPPHDPWFADGWINYYYYGFFLLVLLWNLTGIPVDIAFQLSLATIAGLLASGLFSLGCAVSAAIFHTRRQPWIIAGGVSSTFFVILIGNFDALVQILERGSLRIDFWASSRVVDFGINEFPYFSFLYGDVHPHLIAAPVLVLVLALGYAWICEHRAATSPWVAVWIATTAVVAGSLTLINLWDGPTAAVVLLACLAFPLIRMREKSPGISTRTAIAGIGVVVTCYVLFSRFFNDFLPQTDGIQLTSSGTSLSDFGIHFGVLLVPIILVALTGFARVMRHARLPLDTSMRGIAILLITPLLAVAGVSLLSRPVASAAAMLTAVFIGLFVSNSRNNGAVLISVAGACGAGLILVADLVFIADHLRASDWERMNTIFKLYFQSWTLLGLVAGLAFIWLLYRTWQGLRAPRTLMRANRIGMLVPVTIVALMGLLLSLAYPILATSDRLGHQMATTPSFPSLAGWQWMDGGSIQNSAGDVIEFTGDYEAARWIIEHSDNNPVVLEASIGAYRGGGSRISSITGFPSVLGWASHQGQQRSGPEVAIREAEVREIYQTSDIERKRYLLRRYAVNIVVVGDVERYSVLGDVVEGEQPDYYSTEEGLHAFDEMVGEDLEVVFESGNTTVYRVLPFPSVGQSP